MTNRRDDARPDLLDRDARQALEGALPGFLVTQRWFRGKARPIARVTIADVVPVPSEPASVVAIVAVTHTDGGSVRYVLPLGRDARATPGAVCRLADGSALRAVHAEPGFAAALLTAMRDGATFPGEVAAIEAHGAAPLGAAAAAGELPGLTPRPSGVEQSNTSIVFGERFVLKLFGTLDDGINPDLEVGRFLCERTEFTHVPTIAGWLLYRGRAGAVGGTAGPAEATLGVLQEFVVGAEEAWRHALRAVGDTVALACAGAQPIPEDALGSYGVVADRLGRRVAELHLALASRADDPAFAPEPCDAPYRRATAARMQGLATRNLALLRDALARVPPELRSQAEQVLAAAAAVDARFQALVLHPGGGLRTRVHGDLHLGQLLRKDDDFIFLDFEGEPARPLAERRQKDLPLRDVAGMLRSFHYAALAPLLDRPSGAPDVARALPAVLAWQQAAGARFLAAYLETARGAAFLPAAGDDVQRWLDALVLEKAVYELGYELNNRPAWIAIPLDAILRILAPRREGEPRDEP